MKTALVWLRRDLRLSDNPALSAALEHCERVIPFYLHAPEEEVPWQPGSASRWWLRHSLADLDQRLQSLGSRLIVRQGSSMETLTRLLAESGATHVYWNRLYEPAIIGRDTRIKQALRSQNVTCESFNAALLREPWTVKTGAGGPYRVFTPFWKACQPHLAGSPPIPCPQSLPPVSEDIFSLPLVALELLPPIPWDQGFYQTWQVGENAAQRRLSEFLEAAVGEYPTQRDRPDMAATSRLSPHLHFGEIGPRQIFHAARTQMLTRTSPGNVSGIEAYLRQLGWREFAHHLLYHFPETTESPLNPRFAGFPWDRDFQLRLRAWQRGRTGYPIVDAGMRQLWRTGWMHNRARMIVGSLLTKNLLISWQEGARWFWDTLVDADLANNTLGWQWIAGCGADAAPYFRIFNPMRQAERFDPKGHYVRRWVPELAKLPDKYLQQPWEAPAAILVASGVELGKTYPRPIVDYRSSRAGALRAYEQIK